MQHFIITETVPTVTHWTYHIDAESEDEALEMVKNSKVDPVLHVTENPDYSFVEYKIEGSNDDDDDDEGPDEGLCTGELRDLLNNEYDEYGNLISGIE